MYILIDCYQRPAMLLFSLMLIICGEWYISLCILVIVLSSFHVFLCLSVCLPILNDVTALALRISDISLKFGIVMHNAMRQITIKMFCQFLHIPCNVDIFHDRLGPGWRYEVSLMSANWGCHCSLDILWHVVHAKWFQIIISVLLQLMVILKWANVNE